MSLRVLKISAALTFATALTVGGATATAQTAPLQYTNAAGDVRCTFYPRAEGTHVLCVSDAPGSRAANPECNPPQALIPSLVINTRNETFTNCWNQGMDGTPQALQPGQSRNIGTKSVFADPAGGLVIWDNRNFQSLGYAGTGDLYGFSFTSGSSGS
ncbi:hypothetical protein COCCU_09730 [Corynebacterium occultum]|uniref:Secreted protein n=1 Tax=Corynebacterium occultum TaxID=2675219 RepID=A0A6B8WD09_9CORY|nr:hypothetical protein [Corynebacterium occultum]QGU07870.1 hypothetical protein COCCU_09730 [Corynebacterium occultum]